MDQLPHKEGDWFIHPQTHKVFEFAYEIQTDTYRWIETNLEACQSPWHRQVEAPSMELFSTVYVNDGEGWIPEKAQPAYGIRGIDNLKTSPTTI